MPRALTGRSSRCQSGTQRTTLLLVLALHTINAAVVPDCAVETDVFLHHPIASSVLLQLGESRKVVVAKVHETQKESSTSVAKRHLSPHSLAIIGHLSSSNAPWVRTPQQILAAAAEAAAAGVVAAAAPTLPGEVASGGVSASKDTWICFGSFRAIVGCIVIVSCFAALKVRLAASREDSASKRDQKLPAWVSKADTVFATCDQNKDGHLGFEEFSWLAQRNGRQLTQLSYWNLCRSLGADEKHGLTVQEFRQSYAILGHDVDYDFAVVQRALREGSVPCDAVAPAPHATCRLSLGSPGFASQFVGPEAGKTSQVSSMLRGLSAWIAR